MPSWWIFWVRVGGRGIPKMVCESLPVSFGKRGEVCFVFLNIKLCGFPLNDVRIRKLSYLIRKGLWRYWKLLVDRKCEIGL